MLSIPSALQGFLERLQDSPIGQQIIADQNKATAEELADLERQLAEHREKHLAAMKPLIKEQQLAEADVKKRRDELQGADRRLNRARVAISSAGNVAANNAAQIERVLSLANREALSAFQGRCESERRRLSDDGIREEKWEYAFDQFGNPSNTLLAHNLDQITARLNRLAGARHEAEVICKSKADPQPHLEKLWASLPGTAL